MSAGILAPETVAMLKPKRVVLFTEPDPGIIDHIEKLLEKAKSGEMRALAYAYVTTDGLEPAGGTTFGHRATTGTRYGLTYAIESLRKAWGDEVL